MSVVGIRRMSFKCSFGRREQYLYFLLLRSLLRAASRKLTGRLKHSSRVFATVAPQHRLLKSGLRTPAQNYEQCLQIDQHEDEKARDAEQ